MPIEFKLRRRESAVRRGDRIWREGMSRLHPDALGVNGTIARVDWQAKEAIAIFDDGSCETYSIYELQNKWTDTFEGCYIIEENASAEAYRSINGFPSNGE